MAAQAARCCSSVHVRFVAGLQVRDVQHVSELQLVQSRQCPDPRDMHILTDNIRAERGARVLCNGRPDRPAEGIDA
jgi:hypothetical protein